jgi:hypothetical protein
MQKVLDRITTSSGHSNGLKAQRGDRAPASAPIVQMVPPACRLPACVSGLLALQGCWVPALLLLDHQNAKSWRTKHSQRGNCSAPSSCSQPLWVRVARARLMYLMVAAQDSSWSACTSQLTFLRHSHHNTTVRCVVHETVANTDTPSESCASHQDLWPDLRTQDRLCCRAEAAWMLWPGPLIIVSVGGVATVCIPHYSTLR